MAAVQLMTLAEYSRHRGVNKSSVTRAIAAGRITTVERDGKVLVDPVVADIQWAANTNEKLAPPRAAVSEPAVEAPAVPLLVDAYDRSAAAAKRETHEANLAQMRELKEAGALVERERVVKAATDAGAMLRASLERLPGLAPELAALGDAAAIRARLATSVAEVLADLADNLRELAGRSVSGDVGTTDGYA